MTALKICLTALLSIAELFLLTKLMGKRQLSQMSLFDYINGITIGSIAAEMAISPIDEFWIPAIALAVYCIVAVILSVLTNKSIKFRRIFSGKAIILMDNDKIFRGNLSKAKLDVNEFLCQCRLAGYFNIDDLQTVILEENGQLSFLPKSDKRPINNSDLNLSPAKETAPIVFISDGKILHDNLESCGKNEIWLREQLKYGNFPPIEKIFLAVCENDSNKLYVYEMNDNQMSRDVFS